MLPPKARGVWGKFSALFIRKRGLEICSGTKADGLVRLEIPERLCRYRMKLCACSRSNRLKSVAHVKYLNE